MIDMVHGQRLLVRSLIEAKQGRRVIHVNQKVHIFKNIVDTYDLGKDRGGNFGMVLHNAIEGEHFEVIPGEVPFPDLKPLPPFDVFKFG